MKYSKVGFRSFDHAYVAVPATNELRKLIQDFPGAAEAEYVLTYGYIDHEAGTTLEVLASAAAQSGKGFRFWDSNMKRAVKIRIESIADLECYSLDDDEGKLHGWYKEKIDALSDYEADNDVQRSRKMNFLDPFRQFYHPDDVLVWLFKNGNQEEGCWVRIEALDDKNHLLVGTLLNEPNQDFGCHEGNRIAFFVHEGQRDRHILCADLNRTDSVFPTPQDSHLTLEEAIQACYEMGTRENVLCVLKVLCDSTVLIPCQAKWSYADREAFLKLLETKGENLTGEAVVSQDNIRLIPQILRKDGKSFFPIFSAEEAMGNYSKKFSVVEKHFTEILPMVQHSPEELEGIVVNPFTQPFVVPMELVEDVEDW